MSITTYSELKTAVENWLDHTLFTSRVPEFIALFEATANRRLKVRAQITSSDLVPSGGACTLPTDYIESIRVTRLTTIPQDMEWLEPAMLKIVYPDTVQIVTPPQYAIPSAFFTIEGSTLYVRPKDDASNVQLVYYQKITALSDNATTNWLLTAHPDAYLFGSLVEAEMFGVNDERAPNWKARRDEIFDEIEKVSRASRGSGAIRAIGPTP